MRHFVSVLSFFVTVVVLLGCSQDGTGSKNGLTPVKLQLNWVPEPQFGGIYQARADGFFTQQKLDVDLRAGAAGVSAPQLAARGDVEFAIVGGPQVLQLNAQGGELVALFATFQHDPHGIMVPEDSPYTSLKELWADPKAVIGAESYLAYVKALNRKFGVPNGAQFAPYNLPAFRSGVQQASQCFVMAEPVSLQLQGFKTRVFPANESGFDPYNSVLVTRRSYLESNRETCAAMVRAFSAGWDAYMNSPNRVNELMAELNPGMSVEAMNLSSERQAPFIQDSVTAEHGLGYMTQARWAAIAQALIEMDLMEKGGSSAPAFEWISPQK